MDCTKEMEWKKEIDGKEDCCKETRDEEEEINRFISDTPILYGERRITSDLNRGPATEPTRPRCPLTGVARTEVRHRVRDTVHQQCA
jgi:hypothetical protein